MDKKIEAAIRETLVIGNPVSIKRCVDKLKIIVTQEQALHKCDCSKQLPLVEALEQYIGVLGEELDELASMAVTHGWKSSRVEVGEQMRNRITELKRQLL